MATRSTITFKHKETEFHIYKHWDGYPPAMNDLFKRFTKFNQERADDLSYTIANFIYFVKQDEDSPLTGIGLTTKEDTQEYNYLYEINNDGKVEWKEIK